MNSWRGILNLMVTIIYLFVLCSDIMAKQKSYNGYKVYSLDLKDDEGMKLMKIFEKRADFWARSNSSALVMVKPEVQYEFSEALRHFDISNTVAIENIQQSIDSGNEEQKRSLYNGSSITFDRYYSYNEIRSYLKNLEQQYPKLVKLERYGKSGNDRPLLAIRVSSNSGASRSAIFIDAGIHAREWIAHASALYLIHQLVQKYDQNKDIVNGLDWIIVPCSNPDGYEYSRLKDRLWRKTRERNHHCRGTDGNRNYNIKWEPSFFACSEIYSGTRAFSVPETIGLNKIEKKYQKKLKAYIAVHSSAQSIVYPFSYGYNSRPDDWKELEKLATEAADAMYEIRGNRFPVANSYDYFGRATGCSDDYNKEVLGVKYSYTFESYSRDGFITPPSKIEPAVKEIFAGIRVVALKIKRPN